MPTEKNKRFCDIASLKTKRDCLICGHVTLDECYVSLAAKLASLETRIFESCVEIE